MKRVRFAVTLLIMLSMSLPIIPFDAVAGDGVVRLYAAGSLRPAFTDMISAFQKAQAIKVEPTFGASGLLRERLASGEQGDLFASADMGQPLALQAAGKADRLSCLHAIGYVRWSEPTWTSPRKKLC